jgi:kynurenine formamidase
MTDRNSVISRKLIAAGKAEDALTVDLRKGVNLTTSPAHPRIPFPYPTHTPAFQVLDKPALYEMLGVQPPVSDQGIVSSLENVSSSCDGVCMVTSRIFTVSNAHAGTHADQPGHFLASPDMLEFPDECYNGTVFIVDVRPLLDFLSDGSRMTKEVLQRAIPPAAENAQRLLFKTYASIPQSWDEKFAYFDPDAAKYLVEHFPHLVLVGTDAPSVDHPHAAPIIQKAHGMFWSGQVAILEGLDFSGAQINAGGAVEGVLQTVWSPAMNFHDSKMCSCIFYPRS